MSRFRFSMLLGLLGMSGLSIVSPAKAGSEPLQRTNAGSALYRVTPAMMHAIDVIVAEKMRMMHRHR